jgi:Ni/Co efflux regulator RcnB
MKKSIITLLVTSVLTASMPITALAGINDRHDNRHDRQDNRSDNRGDRQDNRSDNRHDRQHNKRHYIQPIIKPKLIVVTPRKRVFHNVHIHRPYGHAYYGYGHFHTDNDAWKWLAFTAISIKLLDNLNEQSQREHEAAQVKATTAKVGEEITWHTDSSNGSVVTTKEGTNQSGQTCREFQQTITIGGETEQAYGTACLQADGAWKIIE